MEITLNGKPVKLSSRRGKQFVADCAKVASHEITIDQLRRQYELTADALQTIIDDPAFVRVMAKQNKRQAAEASNVVKFPTPSPIDNTDLIVDLCRYSEGILDQQQVRKKYRLLGEDVWQKLGADDALVEKIEDEKIRRIRSGLARREKSALLAMRAPDVVSEVMLSSPSHKARLEGAALLDRFATPPGQAAAADSSRFHIIINMGDEQVTFNKSRSVNVDDPADDSDTTLTITPNKQETDDGQGHF